MKDRKQSISVAMAIGVIGLVASMSLQGCSSTKSGGGGGPDSGGGSGDAASGGDGGSTASCGLLYTKATCASCMTTSCCSQETACASDPGCAGWVVCNAGCAVTDTTCGQNCINPLSSSSSSTANDLLDCQQSHCLTSTVHPCLGQGVPSPGDFAGVVATGASRTRRSFALARRP